jgi:hypothetical protein
VRRLDLDGVPSLMPMNSIQIADETFVCAAPDDVGAAIAESASWARWWPDLRLSVVEDRGPAGQRWTVTGALTGTMEVWLEPSFDGVILHYFLHAEPSGASASQLAKMNLAKMNHRRRQGHGLRAEADVGGGAAGGYRAAPELEGSPSAGRVDSPLRAADRGRRASTARGG